MFNQLATIFKKKMNIVSLSKENSLVKELKLVKDYLARGAFNEAELLCKKYLNVNEDDSMALRMLVTVYANQRKYSDVIEVTERLKNIIGNDLWLINKRIEAFSGQHLVDNTLVELKLAVEMSGRSVLYLFKLALELSREALRDEDAIPLYEEIFKSKDANVSHYMSYAGCFNSIGQTEKAVEILRELLERGERPGQIYWQLSDLKSFRFNEQDIEAMVKLDENSDINATDATSLFFALGKAFEDTAEFDKSFYYYQRANTMKSTRNRYDADMTVNKFKWLTETCNKEFFISKNNISCSEESPIFVVGLHRSGSTLIEQILASHSQVDGTKELPFMGEIGRELTQQAEGVKANAAAYPNALISCSDKQFTDFAEYYLDKVKGLREKAPRFIDKMPANYFHIGLILTLFPNAKIIDARRHPLSVGFSIYRQQLGAGHANDLYDIGHYYQYYVKLMRYWHNIFPGKIHRVQYETMVGDTEVEIRKLLEYCDLPFEEECLSFYNTKRTVKTPSANQVRQPIYKGSLEQWKNYERHLSPLKEGVGEVLDTYDDDSI